MTYPTSTHQAIRRLVASKDAAEQCALAAEQIVATLTRQIGTREGDPFSDTYRRIIGEAQYYADECRMSAAEDAASLDAISAAARR